MGEQVVGCIAGRREVLEFAFGFCRLMHILRLLQLHISRLPGHACTCNLIIVGEMRLLIVFLTE